MPATVKGKELHLDVGAVAPEHLLDVIFAGPWGIVRFRRTGDAIEVHKVLPRLSRRPDLAALQKPKNLTSPPSNGLMGSFVPFMIMTDEVPCPAVVHLKFSGTGTFAPAAATARKREGASSASRNAI